MLESGDWITPVFNGELRYHKPPGIYWLQAASLASLGPGGLGLSVERAVRLPSVLAVALAAAWLCSFLWRRTGSRRAALAAVLLFVSSPMVAVEGRAATTDAVLAALAAAGNAEVWRCTLPLEGSSSPRVSTAVAGCLCSWTCISALWDMNGLTSTLSAPYHPRGPSMAWRRSLRELDEGDLVEGFRSSGDNRFFEELYRRSRRRVFGICWRILADVHWAEDVCHDAFVRAYDRFSSLEGGNFSAWVRRIATNLALNGLRHRSVVERAPVEAPPPPTLHSAEDLAVSAQELDIAEAIIEQLEEHQRRVLLLRHLEDLSYDEIAERTGYRREQVRSFLQNARRNFRLEWQRRTGAGEDAADDGR